MNNLDLIKLNENSTIKEALETINNGGVQIALVVDKESRLIGTITDGDIRRGLLRGIELTSSIEQVIAKNPTVAKVGEAKEEILKKALAKKLHQIIIVNNKNQPIEIKEIEELIQPEIKTNKVVLMLGGLGTRLRPLTEDTPKPMLKVGNKPILETIIGKFKEYGYINFIFCVNYKSHIIQDYFQDGSEFGVKIEYVVEEERMGTAGALGLLKEVPKEPFFVMNGDLLTNINFEYLLEFHITNDAKATMCVKEFEYQIPYGVVNSKCNEISSIEEKPLHKFLVSAGIYVLSPTILNQIPDNQFFDMPTLFNKLIEKNKKVCSYLLEDYWLDIGKLSDFERANSDFEEVFTS